MQCEDDPLLLENRHKWGVERIKDNDGMTKFSTGLPSFAIYLWLFNFLASKCSRMTYWRGHGQLTAGDRVRMSSSYLSPIDQFFAVLMRLKVGLFIQDIAERF